MRLRAFAKKAVGLPSWSAHPQASKCVPLKRECRGLHTTRTSGADRLQRFLAPIGRTRETRQSLSPIKDVHTPDSAPLRMASKEAIRICHAFGSPKSIPCSTGHSPELPAENESGKRSKHKKIQLKSCQNPFGYTVQWNTCKDVSTLSICAATLSLYAATMSLYATFRLCHFTPSCGYALSLKRQFDCPPGQLFCKRQNVCL